MSSINSGLSSLTPNECYTAGSVAAIDVADLSLTRFAALIAPAITRAFVAGMRAAGEDGRALVQRYGGRAIGPMIDLRNPLAAVRSISRRSLADVYRYAEPDELDELIARSVDAGLLEQDKHGMHDDHGSSSFRARVAGASSSTTCSRCTAASSASGGTVRAQRSSTGSTTS